MEGEGFRERKLGIFLERERGNERDEGEFVMKDRKREERGKKLGLGGMEKKGGKGKIRVRGIIGNL